MPCNDKFSTLVGFNGELFSCGSVVGGVTGLGNYEIDTEGSYTDRLRRVKFDGDRDVRVTSVASGCNHSIVTTREGELWSFGSGQQGQLGSGDNIYSKIPQMIKNDVFFVSCAAGSQHSIALDSCGNVWGFGDNLKYQLGLKLRGAYGSPVKIEDIPPMSQIAAGTYHTLATDHTGVLWAVGLNNDSQCGQTHSGETESVVKKFSKVSGEHWDEEKPRITHITCGAVCSAVVDDKHRLWVFGRCEMYRIPEAITGMKDESKFTTACFFSTLPISRVFPLAYWLLAETLEGEIVCIDADLQGYSCTGFGDAEILSHGYCTLFFYEHTQRKLYSYGDNDFGQAGRPLVMRKTLYKPEPVEKFEIPMKINTQTKSAMKTVNVQE